MKMLAIGAAAMAAMLTSAGPAAAQKADPDVACLVALHYGMVALTQTPKPWSDEVNDWQLSVHFSVGFYSGSVLARVNDSQLSALFKVSNDAYLAAPTAQQEQQLLACIINNVEGQPVDRIRASLRTAMEAED